MKVIVRVGLKAGELFLKEVSIPELKLMMH